MRINLKTKLRKKNAKVNNFISYPHTILSEEAQYVFWYTTQKMKFSIKDLFSKSNQTRRKLRIWLHLLKKSFMKNFIFVQCYAHSSYTLYPRSRLLKLQ